MLMISALGPHWRGRFCSLSTCRGLWRFVLQQTLALQIIQQALRVSGFLGGIHMAVIRQGNVIKQPIVIEVMPPTELVLLDKALPITGSRVSRLNQRRLLPGYRRDEENNATTACFDTAHPIGYR